MAASGEPQTCWLDVDGLLLLAEAWREWTGGGARSEHLPKLKALGKQLRKTEVHKSWVPEFWSLSLSALFVEESVM